MSDIQHKTLQARFNGAKCLWTEDECAPDAENESHAWHRLFGEDLPKVAIAKEDYGDCEIFEYPNGRLLQVGPPRSGITEIRVTEKEATVTPDPIRRLAEKIADELLGSLMRTKEDYSRVESILRREGVRVDAGELRPGTKVKVIGQRRTLYLKQRGWSLMDKGGKIYGYEMESCITPLPDATEKDAVK